MLASEMIKDLRELITEHGDLEVVDDMDEPVLIKFNDDGGEPAFLVD